MNLFFDVVMILFSLVLQLVCGDLLAFQIPFAVYALLAFSMRRNLNQAVVISFFAGFIIDLA